MTNTIDKTIDQHIKEGVSFAIWRRPNEERIHYAIQRNGKPKELRSIAHLKGQRGFIMVPFQISDSCPIVALEPDEVGEWEVHTTGPIPKERKAYSDAASVPDPDYAQRFFTFTQPLRQDSQRKLVLSRKKRIRRNTGFSVGKAFLSAVTRYIRSFVYLCHTPQTGTWMGSTPEILLSGVQLNWRTVALAGTQPLRNGMVEEQWSPKNQNEQQLVAQYIHDQLEALGIKSQEKGPYPVRAGEVCHLKSDFFFTLPDLSLLGDLLEKLHPTPAVCGLPKEWALQFIRKEEGYDRTYYSGFVGWLAPQEQSDLYVNLRCMQIDEHHFDLFAGGGLLKASQLDEEWHETEIKLDTMRRLIHYEY